MFREVSMVEVKEILRQRQQGFLRQIARGVGLDRKTVRRYLEAAVAAGFDPILHPCTAQARRSSAAS